jgi:YbbR domain-containing protein
VDVSVSVYPEKTVKVNVSTIGIVADGYSLGEITYNPDTVVIASDAETLAKIDSIDIDNISVSGLDDDFETNVDVADYLPEDVILADDDNKEIAIKIDITKIVQKVINVTTNDITLKNTDPKMEYRVVIPSTYKLTVSATEDKMKDIAADDLNLFLDVKDLGVGNHEVVIGYDISDDYTVSMNSGATVIVKAGEEESGE